MVLSEIPILSGIAFLYRLARDSYAWFRGKRRTLSPEQIIQLRQKWKPAFEQEIYKTRRDRLRPDAIIRDMRRFDNYPNTDEQKGISPWFKVALLGTYHRGILVGLRFGGLTIDQETQKWRYTNYKEKESEDLTAILMGYIPYENIEAVDWEGDEYYGYPHIFCYFNSKDKEPYEKKLFCQERKLHDTHVYYHELSEYSEVKQLSAKRGIKYFS